MARLSKKLRSFSNEQTEGIAHWCPGCKMAHLIYTKNVAGRPTWSWDGNVDLPTTNPSIRSFITHEGVQKTLCHYFLRAGVIEYCGDCSYHDLSGQKVELPDFPEDYGGLDA